MSELPVRDVTGGCACGEHDHDIPVLDARELPHAIRHGAIIGSFSQLAPGSTMRLIAPHNPLPLLDQLKSLNGEDAIEISYVSEDPWTIALTRK